MSKRPNGKDPYGKVSIIDLTKDEPLVIDLTNDVDEGSEMTKTTTTPPPATTMPAVIFREIEDPRPPDYLLHILGLKNAPKKF